MHLKGADSMAISGLSFRNTLVGSGWATAILLCTNGSRKQSSHLAQHPFPAGKPFSSLGKRLLAECRDYCKLINGGCGLSQKCVEDGCKSTCVKFGPEELGMWEV